MMRAHMAPGAAIVVIFLGVSLFPGCVSPGPADQDTRALTRPAAPELDAEAARKALVDAVASSGDDLLKMSLENLRTDPVRRCDRDTIAIGGWYCNLTGRTYVISGAKPPVFIEYAGVFRLGPSGWSASTPRVTRHSAG